MAETEDQSSKSALVSTESVLEAAEQLPVPKTLLDSESPG
jgi:hypothetical protein